MKSQDSDVEGFENKGEDLYTHDDGEVCDSSSGVGEDFDTLEAVSDNQGE